MSTGINKEEFTVLVGLLGYSHKVKLENEYWLPHDRWVSPDGAVICKTHPPRCEDTVSYVVQRPTREAYPTLSYAEALDLIMEREDDE